MASPTTASQVIKKVNQPGLTLWKNVYWQFTYDRVINGHRVNHHQGVNATRLSDLSMGQWEREAQAFMDRIQGSIAKAEAMLPPGTYTGRMVAVTERKDGSVDAQFQVDMPKDSPLPATLVAISIKSGDYTRQRRDRHYRDAAKCKMHAYRLSLSKELSSLLRKNGYQYECDENGAYWATPNRIRSTVVNRIAKLRRMLDVLDGKKVNHKEEYEYYARWQSRQHSYSNAVFNKMYYHLQGNGRSYAPKSDKR